MLGVLGSVLLTVAILPQAIRLIRSQSARDLAWGWIIISVVGCVTLTVHAIAIGDLGFVIVNGTGVAFWGLAALTKVQGGNHVEND